jgi:peptidyl-prolyl cis-trans isomerase C
MKLAVVATALSCMAWSALAAGPLAARVNNVDITAQDVNEYMRVSAGPTGFMLKPGEATVQLIGQELLAQEAIRAGKDRSAGRQTLAKGVMKEFIAANPLEEADVKREYERVKAAQPKETEYKLRMIVVKTDAEARSILAGLAAGKPFASFVHQSIDENTKRDGGASDWMKADEMSVPYRLALRDMKAGDLLKEPLRESYGFVVMKLDDVRDNAFPPYAEVRDPIAQSLIRQRDMRLLKPLAEKATIQQFEGYAPTTINANGERDHGPYVRKIDPQP